MIDLASIGLSAERVRSALPTSKPTLAPSRIVVQPVSMLRVPFKGRVELCSYAEAADLRDALTLALNRKRGEATVDKIKLATCNAFDVRLDELNSRDRTPRVAFARHVVMWLLRTLTSKSQSAIGACFRMEGGKPMDHGTVHHALRNVDAKMAKDKDINDRVLKLQAELIEEVSQEEKP